MKIEYKHELSKQEAYKKIDNFLDGLCQKHNDKVSNPQKRWDSNRSKMEFSFITYGFNISGDICLENGKIVLDSKLPFLARMYSSTIEDTIRKNLDSLFS